MSATELLQVQVGRQTTWTTPVAPIWKLLGVENAGVSFDGEYNAQIYHDQRGSIAPAYYAALEKVGGAVSIKGKALYEDIALIMDAMFSRATPTGAGPYTRNWVGPTTAQTTPSILTIVWGQGSQTWQAEGCVLNSLQIEGEANGPITYTAQFVTRRIYSGSLAALTDRSVTPILGNHAAVAVDPFGATIGTTVISNTALKFNMNITSNRKAKFYLGNVSANDYEDTTWDATLAMTLEMNATSKAYVDAVYNSTPALFTRLTQIKFDDTSERSFTLQFAGVASEGPRISDMDGIVVTDLSFKSMVDTGAFANFVKASSINSVATLP